MGALFRSSCVLALLLAALSSCEAFVAAFSGAACVQGNVVGLLLRSPSVTRKVSAVRLNQSNNQPQTGRDDQSMAAEWMRLQEELNRQKELGLVDQWGKPIDEKKPAIALNEDQEKWKADKAAKQKLDEQAVEAKMAMWLKAAADKKAAAEKKSP